MGLLYDFFNKFIWMFLRIGIAGYILYILLLNAGLIPDTIDSTFQEVSNLIKNNSTFFKSVTINEFTNYAYFYTNDTMAYKISISGHSDFGEKLSNNLFPIYYTTSKSILSYAFDILFYWLIFNTIIFIISRYISNAISSNISVTNILGKDNAPFSPVAPDENGTKFKDIIGHKEGKKDLLECVKFFEHRDKYIKTGYEIPKGLLLVGEPGTGKTLLARAFANEAKVNFISVCGSDFIEMFVGVGSKRVKELFQSARASSPCVIFIDEIDAIGSQRAVYSHGHNEHGSTLNKLLSEMDGFEINDNIMVLAATNRVETLDKALIRSGRFDKEIYFDPPNLDERKDLFKLFVSKIKLDNSFKENNDSNLTSLARMTAGLTGADIKNICNQAIRMFMGRVNLDSNEFKESGVEYKDLAAAIDVVMIGIEKPERKMTEHERKIVSYHEAGHSLMAYMLKDTDIPIKVSIIPRGKSALGFSQQEPSDRKIMTKSELMCRLCVLLGGRVAERLQFDHYSTGAADDIEKATNLAYFMVSKYGMIDSIGPMNPSYEKSKYISDETKRSVDYEVINLLKDIENKTKSYISEHMDELHVVAGYLLEHEVILSEDMDRLLENYNIKNKF